MGTPELQASKNVLENPSHLEVFNNILAFKKKSKIEVLDKKYQRLLKESYRLSTISRKESDKKVAEANEILKEIELLETEKIN